MGYSRRDAHSLVDLVQEMEAELRGDTERADTDRIDWTSMRDPVVQSALLRRIGELSGSVTVSDLRAEVAHLPSVSARIPRFLAWAYNQDLLRVIAHDDQGKRYELTASGAARAAAGTELPSGSTLIS